MTTRTQPITKLYKRCQRSNHSQCPGKFEDWPVCSCDCHGDTSAVQPQAEISQQDTEAAVVEAQSIVTPVLTLAVRARSKDTWDRAFTPCAEHAPIFRDIANDPAEIHRFTHLLGLQRHCRECQAATRANIRADLASPKSSLLAREERETKYRASHCGPDFGHYNVYKLKLTHDAECDPMCHCRFSR